VAGPANRNLDTFYMESVDAAGNLIDAAEVVNGEGRAINIEGAAKLRVDTGKRLNGASNPTPKEANA
jgi:hypothetical protein